jgi:hypothetical protein
VKLQKMPKEQYLDALTAKMRSWRERLGSDENPEIGEKYEQVVDLLTAYERMGAGAWREEERALNEACTKLEQAFRRS